MHPHSHIMRTQQLRKAKNPCAALQAKSTPANQLPGWQQRRVKLLDQLCGEIHALIDQGSTIHQAAAEVSRLALKRKANANIPRCPITPSSLIRFYYLWKSGPVYLASNHGRLLPAVSERDTLDFINWVLGRRSREFAGLWQEFQAHHKPKRAKERQSRVHEWFRLLRQRLAHCEARAKGGRP